MYFSRCSYSGQHTKDQKRMHGRGIFTFANGNKYVGTFHDGAFHGQGIIFFTEQNGGGQFRGVWDLGRNTLGEYIFSDGLPFLEKDWGHCTENDRRLWDEYLVFISPTTPQLSGVAPVGSDAVIASSKTITPNYATSDGIPAAFAGGKPRAFTDVTDAFWQNAPNPPPEHEVTADPSKEPDVAAEIAIACPRPHTK